MADRLLLTGWMPHAQSDRPLRGLELFLSLFPVSRLYPAALIRVFALNLQESPLAEQYFDDVSRRQALIEFARRFENRDYGWQVELFWDLWQFEDDWRLAPARITATVFGPDFERDEDEHLLAELGPDLLFLPHRERVESLRFVQSNVRSLLKLVRDLEQKMPLVRRRLWTESGLNFAEKLEEILRSF